jgi:hypothetical protein
MRKGERHLFRGKLKGMGNSLLQVFLVWKSLFVPALGGQGDMLALLHRPGWDAGFLAWRFLDRGRFSR